MKVVVVSRTSKTGKVSRIQETCENEHGITAAIQRVKELHPTLFTDVAEVTAEYLEVSDTFEVKTVLKKIDLSEHIKT